MPINQEEKIVKVIENSLPGVVSITSYEKPGKESNYPSKKDTGGILNKILKQEKKCGGGSGFIVSKDGVIVTAMHVISEKDMNYTVMASNQESFKAKKIGIDIVNDIAFLKIESQKEFSPLPLGTSTGLKLGQGVLAIGNVLGIFQNTVSKGIISGLSRSINASNEEIEENLSGLIQTDAAINPGNSGGPLIDMNGKVIGINSASVAQAENIGFAIPINTILKDLEKIRKFGSIKKAFLGIRYVNVNPQTKKIFRVNSNNGILVISHSSHQPAVIKNSPAEIAGIKERDIITEINGNAVNSNFNLQKFLDQSSIGQSVDVKITRSGKILNTKVKLAEM